MVDYISEIEPKKLILFLIDTLPELALPKGARLPKLQEECPKIDRSGTCRRFVFKGFSLTVHYYPREKDRVDLSFYGGNERYYEVNMSKQVLQVWGSFLGTGYTVSYSIKNAIDSPEEKCPNNPQQTIKDITKKWMDFLVENVADMSCEFQSQFNNCQEEKERHLIVRINSLQEQIKHCENDINNLEIEKQRVSGLSMKTLFCDSDEDE